MKRLQLLVLCSVLFTVAVFGQELKNVSVSGRILDRLTMEPISGVSIHSAVMGHTIVSNPDGFFGFELKGLPDTLYFRHLEYDEYTWIVDRQEVDRVVLLGRGQHIMDIVEIQTGYQSLKSNEVTGSVQVIDQKMLNQQVGTNILDRIKHVVPSVLFDSAPIENPDLQRLDFSVRGLSTIAAYRDPLIVLDGFIYEGKIENIDPNHIESLTILKDAAATSIWGARAGNGVLVITSKQFQPSAHPKVNISFNSVTTLRDKPDLNQQYQLSNGSFIEIEEMLFQRGFYNSQLNNLPYLAVTPAIEIYHQRRQGLISAVDSARAIDALLLTDGRREYSRLFYSTPILSQNHLNIQGGHESMSYNLGVGHLASQSELGSTNEKITFNFSNVFKISESVRLKIHSVLTNNWTGSGKPAFESLKVNGKAIPYSGFQNEQGEPLPFDRTYRMAYMESFMGDYLLDWAYYPLTDDLYSRSKNRLNEWYTTAELNLKLFPFLDMNLGGQYQNQRDVTEALHEQESHHARMMINQFSSVNETTGVVSYVVPIGGIKEYGTRLRNSYTMRSQMNLRHSWLDHYLSGIIGSEIRQSKGAGESFTVYGYNELPLRSVSVDHKNRYPIIPGGGTGTITGSPNYIGTNNRFVSFYSNFIYLYKNKYGLSASLRRDGANIFGATTNNKWKPFWSVGTSWDLKREGWFDDKLIEALKLRATYGFSGNVDLRKTASPIASSSSGNITNFPALVIGTLNDPTLRWEQVWSWNLGTDFSVLGGMVSGMFDVYTKIGKDLYGQSGYDYTVWGRSSRITKNVGSMRSWGTDLLVKVRILDQKLGWTSVLNLSTNKNKTTDYYQANNTGITSFLSSGNSITPIIGRPLHALSAYTWKGLDASGNPQGSLDGNLSINYNAIRNAAYIQQDEGGGVVFIGSSKPQVFGSVINSFHYGPVALSFNFSFKGDYYFRKPVTNYGSLFSSGIAYPDYEQRWRNPGDENVTDVPSVIYPENSSRSLFYAQSEINIRKGDHIALEYITLSYTSNVKIGQISRPLELYFNGQNLGLIWTANPEGLHPAYPYQMQPQRSFSLGIRTSF